jgi:hypothetical protein
LRDRARRHGGRQEHGERCPPHAGKTTAVTMSL